MESYEKLGAFFLGRPLEGEGESGAGEPEEGYLLYDSKDLTTHAMCVGMTGSGKTGLCVSLLEEAAIDGVPAIAIDPKGDLGNLMLTFDELEGSSFRPWINEDDARKKGLSPDDFADSQADLWRNGLAKWGQSAERIARLRSSADFRIYTPGSNAGIPLSIMASFSAPPAELIEDGDLYRDRINTTVTSLLTLLGVDADPIQSPEHVLLSTILDHYWRQGTNLDLAALIVALQKPPVDRIGVLDLESFYPAKERFKLAMRLNGLLAAPGFQNWLEGETLDVDQLLYTPEGKPRVAIISIAHLGEAERMFFVSLLFNEVLAWMRTRPGTDSLRAILYMDEIFGYMPPVAEPPSKKPLLTLLKQARAYGLGVVLATQNPVDLDYKGLSNIGTWFLGRLQTERDKMRVLEGLEGVTAGGEFDRQQMEKTLAGLGKRIFLLHNVHEPEPVLFHTRWAMSYLRGPLTRGQIKTVMKPYKAEMAPPVEVRQAVAASAPQEAPPAPEPKKAPASTRPIVPPETVEVFLPVATYAQTLQYSPAILGEGTVHFTNRKRTVETSNEVRLAVHLGSEMPAPGWKESEELLPGSTAGEPQGGAGFDALPRGGISAKQLSAWKKSFSDHLYRSRSCVLLRSPGADLLSEPGEAERDFRIRLADASREVRDERTAALRKKFAPKLARLEERIRLAEERVEREKVQATTQKLQSAISVGAAIFSAFLGRKKISSTSISKAGTAARSISRSGKERGDIERAEENVEALQEKLAALAEELEQEVEELEERLDPLREELETVTLKPRRTDVQVERIALAWMPYEPAEEGPRWLYQR